MELIREPLILLLLGIGILYSIWGGWHDALTIVVIILIMVGAEVVTDYRTSKELAGLTKLAEPTARVVRDGQDQEVAATLTWSGKSVGTPRMLGLDVDSRPPTPRAVMKEWVEHYNRARPQRGLELKTPIARSDPVVATTVVRCHARLGGLLREYSSVPARAAA